MFSTIVRTQKIVSPFSGCAVRHATVGWPNSLSFGLPGGQVMMVVTNSFGNVRGKPLSAAAIVPIRPIIIISLSHLQDP